MNTINSIGSQPVAVPAEGAAPAAAASAAVAATAAQESPSVASASQPSAAAPTLPPPALKVDYSGARSTMSAYTALIVLVCETNRESYAANRALAKTQMQARVAELKDVAAKRKTAAIVGIAMSVVSGIVGVAGGVHGIVGSSKNMHALRKLTPADATDNTLKGKAKARPDAQESLYVSAELKTEAPDAPKPQAKTDGAPESAAADKKSKDKADKTDKTDKTDKASKADKGGASEGMDRELTLRGVEVESARLQSLAVLYGAIQNSANSLGQSASGIVSAEADIMAADAETTEAARQTTVSSMQQFQDLMSKFTQILSALLEAENKARSAAAQA